MSGGNGNTTETRPKESQATTLVRLVLEARAALWHTCGGDTYVSVVGGVGHREHHQLGSRASRDYLSQLFYVEMGKAPRASALQDALATLGGMAKFDGPEHSAYVRVAGVAGDDGDARLYLDLCDRLWRAVEVTTGGWRVVDNPPVRFRRSKGMLPLPVPERGGSIDDLRHFLNVASDDDFAMLAIWLLAALRSRGPYPILIFIAEQGAAKTSATRVLRRLCDPNQSDVRRPPRNAEDLMIAASNGHIVAYDNLSRLSEDLSDNLSVLATGGGFAVRQLYTNTEEVIFDAQRPIILNGISQVATRGDLLDRAIVITLPAIPDHRRKDEEMFWAEFERARRQILGALLDAVARGLQRLPSVHLERMPRMDFARWGVAVEPACPWPTGRFLSIYNGNRQNAVEATMDGEPVADLVRTIAPWSGTASELLRELNQQPSVPVTKPKDWPSRPRELSDALRRLAPGLRRMGIEVSFGRATHGRRLIHVEKAGRDSSPASPASPTAESRGRPGDAAGEGEVGSADLSSPAGAHECEGSDAGDASDESVGARSFASPRFDPTKAFADPDDTVPSDE